MSRDPRTLASRRADIFFGNYDLGTKVEQGRYYNRSERDIVRRQSGGHGAEGTSLYIILLTRIGSASTPRGGVE